MASSKTPRWVIVGLLVALGIIVVALWPGESTNGGVDSDADYSEERAPDGAALPTVQNDTPDGGIQSNRRIKPGCDPVEESLKYEQLIDRKALAILKWNQMSERAANLEIPVYVVGIENGSVGVRFMQFPMREQYLAIWLGSGHIQPGPKDVFLLDPCSATIVVWKEMERNTPAGDQ